MTRLRRWGPSVAWGVLILTATSLPGAIFTGAPIVPGADKVVHATMYGVLAFLVWSAVATDDSSRRAARVAIVVAALALFAGADEWHQQFVPGRSADVADWMADVAGATVGATLSRTAPWRRGILS